MTRTRFAILLLMAMIALDGCKRRPPPQTPSAQPANDTISPNTVSILLPAGGLAATADQMGEAACQARDQTHARLVSAQPAPNGTRFVFACVP